jgi:hypothetical protein
VWASGARRPRCGDPCLANAIPDGRGSGTPRDRASEASLGAAPDMRSSMLGPRPSSAETILVRVRVRVRYGRIWRSANRTFAGRSASRRMYHGYHDAPYATRVNAGKPSRWSFRSSAARMP